MKIDIIKTLGFLLKVEINALLAGFCDIIKEV